MTAHGRPIVENPPSDARVRAVRASRAAMASPEDTPVAILCGGRGTRLQERTHAIPKALVEIGGRPIVWHVIQLYVDAGVPRDSCC